MMMLPVGLPRLDFFYKSLSISGLPDSSEIPFILQPQYRARSPLEAVLLKVQAEHDDFVTEIYHDRIAAILAEWSSGWLRSPQSIEPIEKSLAEDFLGSSLRPNPSESRVLRSGPTLEITQNNFSSQSSLQRSTFLEDLRSAFNSFSKLFTAELQVTGLAADSSSPPGGLKTRVRYDFVGEGMGFHREQRVGCWDLEWQGFSNGNFQLRRWHGIEETRSRSTSPVFVDIAVQAIAGNPSYSAQLLHGADYWRTVLDGACGIDIYGHNGVSVADIDNDGWDDLYVCQPAGLPNRLYRNRGDGTFEDVTESSGLGLLENTACALFADFDNDGRQDVILVGASGPKLFLNEGGGIFRQKRDAFQFANPPRGTFTGAAVADYDGDGWLDVYFCLYIYYQGTDQYKYPVPYHDAENGPPNFMMRNNRDGTFRDITAEAGLNQNNTRYSFCCGWSDYNRDGWPDLYVVNDFGRKNLYRNNGNGTFTDVAAQAGVEDVGAGMSACWLDYDNDARQDLYVGDMWTAAGERISAQAQFKKNSPPEVRALYRKHAMGNSLFKNAGGDKDGSFVDKTAFAGVDVGRWAWSSDAFDFDHDGFPDVYIANGMISGASRHDLNSFFWRQVVAKSPDTPKSSAEYEQGWSAINELIRADATWSGFERNIFYFNNRDGTFSDISGAAGLDFIEDGRAFALADFDQDGRQEIFLKNRNAPQLRVLKNRIENLPPSIAFQLCGTMSNRDAIGAEVTVETELGRQIRMLQAGSGFLSQHSKELFFGLGATQGPVKVSIHWPSGLQQEFHDLPINRRIWIEEGSEKLRIEPFKMRPMANLQLPNTDSRFEPLPTTFETWLLAPVPVPEISLPDFQGRKRQLSEMRGKPVLLNFWVSQSSICRKDLDAFNQAYSRWAARGLQLFTVNMDGSAEVNTRLALPQPRRFSFPIVSGSDDVAGIYNLLYRHLFDRRRELTLPTSFLIDAQGQIVKVYQGSVKPEQVEKDVENIPRTRAEKLARALPFPGVSETFEFGRNHLSFGAVYFQRGYFEQAESSFRLALQDDPSSAEACYGLGSALLRQRKTAEARDNFDRATKLRSNYPDTLANAWNNLGLIATEENQTEEAIHYFQQALRSSPDHLIALNNLGNAYRLQKNWDAARKSFERALEVSSTDAESNYGLAMVFAQADDTAEAYDYLQAALKSRPDYPEALNNLGILYLRTNRRDKAVASFEECIRVAPGFDQSYLNLARVYGIEGDSGKARTVLLALLKQHPESAAAKSMLEQLSR
jgi:tetratricopeptide (TPR) repeat protein/peroxiredoxin